MGRPTTPSELVKASLRGSTAEDDVDTADVWHLNSRTVARLFQVEMIQNGLCLGSVADRHLIDGRRSLDARVFMVKHELELEATYSVLYYLCVLGMESCHLRQGT
jgi:hypothetical protein